MLAGVHSPAVASLIQHAGPYGDVVANCYTVTNTR
jgi:hypothetical protein